MHRKHISRVLVLVVLVVFSVTSTRKVTAQGTSTPVERAQWVETTHKLESRPFDESLDKQGESALKQVSDAHDIHVPLCPSLLSEFNGMKYAYAHTITRQYMLASAAFIIENPGKARDTKAMNLTAVESVLKTYSAILQQKPEAKAKPLDDLLKKQSQGELPDALKQCP
jgi:hypothetical protein